MDDHALRRAFASAQAPPPFDAVAAKPSVRRLRKVRASLAACALVVAAAAPFLLRQPERGVDFALAAPPTTDWLLETPDPEWIANLERESKMESADAP
jgi:hypothetical protein